MYKTTIKELGPRLPIGFFDKNGGLQKTFQLRPYKAKIDRLLGQWRQVNSSKYGEHQLTLAMVPKLLSLLVSQTGSRTNEVTSSGDSLPESEYWLHTWHFCDVLYAYIYARIQAVGNILVAPVACPSSFCDFKTEAGHFDLEQVGVRVAENVEDTYMWYDLRDPIILQDGRKVEAVKLAPLKWLSMMNPNMLASPSSQIDVTSLRGSIVAINHNEKETATLTEAEIDEISKYDLVALNARTGELSVGLDLFAETPCPACGTPIIDSLNWEYSYFFGMSSPSVQLST